MILRLVIYFFLTLLNLFYLNYSSDFEFFWARQVTLTLFSLLSYFFQDIISQFSLEEEKIELILQTKYSFLRVEKTLFLLTILSIVLVTNFSMYPDFYLLICLSQFLIFSYVLFSLCKAYCILQTPAVREFFSVKRIKTAISQRNFSTLATVASHWCKTCGKVGAVGIGGVWLGPKMVHGDPFYRGDWWNNVTYPFTGYKSRSEIDCALYNHYINRYPEERQELLDKNRYIRVAELERRMAEKKVFPFPGPIPVEHKWPKIDWLWNWGKK